MDNLNSLTIDPTPAAAEPTIDHEAVAFDLRRHAALARQVPGYLGSAVHVGIRERLAKQGIKI